MPACKALTKRATLFAKQLRFACQAKRLSVWPCRKHFVTRRICLAMCLKAFQSIFCLSQTNSHLQAMFRNMEKRANVSQGKQISNVWQIMFVVCSGPKKQSQSLINCRNIIDLPSGSLTLLQSLILLPLLLHCCH